MARVGKRFLEQSHQSVTNAILPRAYSVKRMRLAVVADSHLAPDAQAFNRNWCAVREFIGSLEADLTVHLGDITVDGLSDPTHFQHALAVSADWPTPIRYVPGNHDIGDNPPGPGVPAKQPLETARLGDFRSAPLDPTIGSSTRTAGG